MSDGHSTEPAQLRIEGAVATIALDRPDRLNAIDVGMAACLRRLGDEVAALEEVRVLVLEGRGPAFCAGGDVGLFAAHLDDLAPVIRALLAELHEFLITLRTMPKAVVTKLHGPVAGAGLSLACMGDVAIAAEDARFVPAYGKLGVSPDGGGTVGLAGRAGARRALRIYLAEDSFSAAQAEAWGLVDMVVPASELEGRTATLTARLARNAPAALAATKRIVLRESEAELRARLDAEQEALLGCIGTEAFRTAVLRFAAPRA